MENIDTKTATSISMESSSKIASFDGVDMAVTKQNGVRKHYRNVYEDGILRYIANSAYLIHFGEKGERPYLNILLLCVPLAIICDAAGADKAVTFVFSLLGICPLAYVSRFFYSISHSHRHNTQTTGNDWDTSLRTSQSTRIQLWVDC